MKVLILAGGSGTRLWPLSRESYPKQFIKLLNAKTSLFQDTIKRSMELADLSDIYVITNRRYKMLIEEQLSELRLAFLETNILYEPEPKNTLPAIYYGVVEACREEDDTIVVFPSDHKILDNYGLIESIQESIPLSSNHIVTFGIKPNNANIGYGYILTGSRILNGYMVKKFKEKPDLQTAKEYVSKGYLWNSGMFMFHSRIFKEELKKYTFDIYEAFETGINIVEIFEKIEEGISVDYGLIEKTDKVVVVPLEIGWSDLGSFDSIYDVFEKDNKNNIACNDEILIEAKNNLILSDKKKEVVVVGIEDLIVVDNHDALLICNKRQSYKIKEVLSLLKKDNRL